MFSRWIDGYFGVRLSWLTVHPVSHNRKKWLDCGELENFALLEELSVRNSSLVHVGFTEDSSSLCAVVMLDLGDFLRYPVFYFSYVTPMYFQDG